MTLNKVIIIGLTLLVLILALDHWDYCNNANCTIIPSNKMTISLEESLYCNKGMGKSSSKWRIEK